MYFAGTSSSALYEWSVFGGSDVMFSVVTNVGVSMVAAVDDGWLTMTDY